MHLGQLQVIVHSARYEGTSTRLLLSCWQKLCVLCLCTTKAVHCTITKPRPHESICCTPSPVQITWLACMVWCPHPTNHCALNKAVDHASFSRPRANLRLQLSALYPSRNNDKLLHDSSSSRYFAVIWYCMSDMQTLQNPCPCCRHASVICHRP